MTVDETVVHETGVDELGINHHKEKIKRPAIEGPCFGFEFSGYQS